MRILIVVVSISCLLGLNHLAYGQGGLTEERLEKLLEQYPKADANEDGVLTKAEALAFRKSLSQFAPEDLAMFEPDSFDGMPYRLMKPIDFDPTGSYPLILCLHGAGGRGTDNVKQFRPWTRFLMDEAWRRKYPCFVLAPQTPQSWSNPEQKALKINDELLAGFPEVWLDFIEKRRAMGKSIITGGGGDLLRVFELLESTGKEYKIDRDRIYVLGHSMGGFGSWNAIWEKPDLFAAAIPSAGALDPRMEPERFKDVPIWAFHGIDDKTVPHGLTQLIFDSMKECGGNMKFTSMEGVGHGAGDYAFVYQGDDADRGFVTRYTSDCCDHENDVWDWLFAKSLSQRREESPDK